MFAHAAAAGLLSGGWDVIDLGVVPTPTAQLAVEHHGAGAGLILTASHNPIEWNALKYVGPDGIFLDATAGAAGGALGERGPAGLCRERAAGAAGRGRAGRGPPRAGWDGIGSVREDREAVARHLDLVLD